MVIPIGRPQLECTFLVAKKLKHLSQLKFGKIETKINPVISKEIGIEPTPFATKVLFQDGKVIAISNRSKWVRTSNIVKQ